MVIPERSVRTAAALVAELRAVRRDLRGIDGAEVARLRREVRTLRAIVAAQHEELAGRRLVMAVGDWVRPDAE